MFNNRNLWYNLNSELKDFYVRYRYKFKQYRRTTCHKKRSFKVSLLNHGQNNETTSYYQRRIKKLFQYN